MFQPASAGFENSTPSQLNRVVKFLRGMLSRTKIVQIRGAIATANLVQVKSKVFDGVLGEHAQQKLTPLFPVRTR